MKVLHVIPAVAPRYGGPSAAAIGLAGALRKAGVDARIATTSADGEGDLPVPLGAEVDYEGVPAIFFKRTFSESFKYSGSLAAWLNKNVAEYDLVHVHAVFSHSSIAAARACARSAVPYIVRPLGSLYGWGLAQRPSRKKIFLAVAGRRMLRKAYALHYTSVDEKTFAEARFRVPRGFITALGVDEEILSNPPGDLSETEPYVLFAGRLHPVKRLDWLIAAFAAASSSGWRLVIAGEGPPEYRQSLEALAQQHGARDRVDFVGWKSGAEKRRLLSGASLAALVASQENFGIFAAEAMAAGVPVVVSAEVGLRDHVAAATAGWVVKNDDLQATLDEAMANMDERRRRGAAARKWAERYYRWDSVASQVVKEYEAAMRQA